MLVDLNISKDKIEKEIKLMETWVSKNNSDKMSVYIREEIEQLKKADLNNFLNRNSKGIYEGYINDGDMKEYLNVNKVIAYGSFNIDLNIEFRDNFGIADNVEQIINYYPEIQSKDHEYVVIYQVEKQSKKNDFRWHKHGKYIGTKKPQHEYFSDDKHIEEVVLYHVYEITEWEFGGN